MVTIRIDIDRDAPVDEWIEWYDYTLRLGMLDAPYPNYDSWLRGCPIQVGRRDTGYGGLT